MPNETNTVGATMELGRLRIENETLRQQNAELVALIRDALDDHDSDILGDDWTSRAESILAAVQS